MFLNRGPLCPSLLKEVAISKELGFLQESPVRRRKRLKLGAGEGERVSQGEISLRSNNLSDHLAGAWSPMTKQMARAHSNNGTTLWPGLLSYAHHWTSI